MIRFGGVTLGTSFGTKVFLFVTLATLLVSMMPVSADNVAVRVQAGDWAKYGEISVTWWSSEAEPAPQILVDWNNSKWVKIEVQSVSGTNITAVQTNHFKNGTENTETYTWNMTDRTRFLHSLWYAPDLFVIEANLSNGDLINIESLTLTDTVSRKYAGRTREVNQMKTTFGQGVIILVTVNAYWDKTTGILCELNETRLGALPGLYSRTSMTTKIIATNLWQPTPIWTEPWFWIITLVIVAAVAVPAIWVWRRRKVALHKEEAVSAPTP